MSKMVEISRLHYRILIAIIFLCAVSRFKEDWVSWHTEDAEAGSGAPMSSAVWWEDWERRLAGAVNYYDKRYNGYESDAIVLRCLVAEGMIRAIRESGGCGCNPIRGELPHFVPD